MKPSSMKLVDKDGNEISYSRNCVKGDVSFALLKRGIFIKEMFLMLEYKNRKSDKIDYSNKRKVYYDTSFITLVDVDF